MTNQITYKSIVNMKTILVNEELYDELSPIGSNGRIFLDLLDILVSPQPEKVFHNIQITEELKNIVLHEQTTRRYFSSISPINARRECRAYNAEIINRLVSEIREKNETVFNALEFQNSISASGIDTFLRNLEDSFTVVINFNIQYYFNNMFIGIISHPFNFPTNTLLELEKEYKLYEENGFDIGGPGPGKFYLRELKREIEFLPDENGMEWKVKK